MALYRVNKPRNPQANFHVKKNDEVVVLTGTQQGKRGKVLQVLRDRGRVIIEGVNFIKKAARKSQEQPQGGIIEREGALHISKVMLAADYDSRKGGTASSSKTTESEASKHAAKHPAKHAATHPAKHAATHPAKHAATHPAKHAATHAAKKAAPKGKK
jgi:large subunit ribosomal protein L24